MQNGQFINFYLPYSNDGVMVSPGQQAQQIIDKAKVLIACGATGVAITYSANYGQTRTIEQVYDSGGWDTQTSGANQAMVMYEMEALMGSADQDLQGKLRIAPITTMNAYENPVNPWDEGVLLNIVVTDLNRIQDYLTHGWVVLGWQNQGTVNDPAHPYAVGGGVATLPPLVSDKIQQTLINYSQTYPEA